MTALFAEGTPAPTPDPGPFGGPLVMFWMLGVFFLLWVVVLRPAERRRQKEQADMLSNLKRGTKVVTSGGIIGTVVSVKDNEDEITLRSEDTRLKVRRSTVIQVLGSDEKEAG